ncbi:MAG TPA: YlbF family regulator [Acholeplasmataceae bacterium]|mgnify:CR=1 FL=1|nr:YlbF family regulator [Acholeplasmataceae bacterium]
MTEKEKLIQMIEEDEEIQRYKRIELAINQNRELKAKFNELKSVQKQLVNAKHIGKKEAIDAFQTRYDALYEAIEAYPLMSDYLALQSDINDMIQSIVGILEEGLEKDFEK